MLIQVFKTKEYVMKSINMVSDSVCATSKPLKGRRDQFWLIATSATTKRQDKSFFFFFLEGQFS